MPSNHRARNHLWVVDPAPNARPRYLHKRGGVYYFKRKIPADVADGFPGYREQMWKSLGTGLVLKARVLLAVETTEFELRVAELRRQNAVRWMTCSGLASDRALTDTPTCTSVGGDVRQPQADLGPNHVERRAAGSSTISTQGCPVPSREQPAPPSVGVHTVSDRPQPPLATGLTNALAVPPAEAPKLVAITLEQTVGPAARRPTLLHLLEDWKLKQTRPRTVNAVNTAVMEFRTLHGPMAVEDITKANVRVYRDQLIEQSLSKATIENRLGFLATLVRHGMKELVEHLTANPFERIEVLGAKGLRVPKDRRAYEVTELNALFMSRLYTGDFRPAGQCVDAAYWAPLMGPFLGARIEEVCQLRVDDVQRVNGIWCVRICDLDEQQNVKTLSSFRRVPLHDVVIKAGFLVYAAGMAKAGHQRLFPTLSNVNANGIYSNALGKWYGRFLESIGLLDHRLDYHSFRYSFRQQCSLCGVENEVRDALTGHWLNNSDSGRTYMKGENRQYPFPKLVAAIQQLRYDELRISHLFIVDPMANVENLLLR